jgi:hypothetical protein
MCGLAAYGLMEIGYAQVVSVSLQRKVLSVLFVVLKGYSFAKRELTLKRTGT